MTKHIVCYSKGHASGRVAYEVVKRYGPINTILVNHDINDSVEHPDIKRFAYELAGYLTVPITYVNHPEFETKDQFDVCMDAKAFKIDFHPLCTSRLKTQPFHSWLDRNYPPGSDVMIYYGFEASEPKRIARRRSILAEKGYKTCFPLAEWKGCISDVKEIGIEPPSTYEVWKHANCVGCLRAGQQHWYVVYCRRPDIWEKAKHAESVIGYSILRIDNKPVFLKELETKFEAMRLAGIEAEEKTPPGKFWSRAKKILGTGGTV